VQAPADKTAISTTDGLLAVTLATMLKSSRFVSIVDIPAAVVWRRPFGRNAPANTKPQLITPEREASLGDEHGLRHGQHDPEKHRP